MKRHDDGDWMPYRGCLLVAAFVKIGSICLIYMFIAYSSNFITFLLNKQISLNREDM